MIVTSKEIAIAQLHLPRACLKMLAKTRKRYPIIFEMIESSVVQWFLAPELLQNDLQGGDDDACGVWVTSPVQDLCTEAANQGSSCIGAFPGQSRFTGPAVLGGHYCKGMLAP